MPRISPGVAKMIEAFNEFGPGVPATDKVCKELLKVLEVQWQQTHDNGVETPWLHNEEAKDDYALVFRVNEDYCVEVGKERTGRCRSMRSSATGAPWRSSRL